MWIINDDGFFSAVQDRENDAMLYVRSRSETDLQEFINTAKSDSEESEWEAEIIHTPERDYQWRVHASKQIWAEYLAAKARNIDYGNFKSHCAETWVSEQRDHARERLSVLNDAWLLFNHWPSGELFEDDGPYG